jgi:hypothetical protein
MTPSAAGRPQRAAEQRHRSSMMAGQEQQTGSPSADRVLGLGIDERFSRNGATLLTEALGSTVAPASAGGLQTSYGYDPYGASQVAGTASVFQNVPCLQKLGASSNLWTGHRRTGLMCRKQ